MATFTWRKFTPPVNIDTSLLMYTVVSNSNKLIGSYVHYAVSTTPPTDTTPYFTLVGLADMRLYMNPGEEMYYAVENGGVAAISMINPQQTTTTTVPGTPSHKEIVLTEGVTHIEHIPKATTIIFQNKITNFEMTDIRINLGTGNGKFSTLPGQIMSVSIIDATDVEIVSSKSGSLILFATLTPELKVPQEVADDLNDHETRISRLEDEMISEADLASLTSAINRDTWTEFAPGIIGENVNYVKGYNMDVILPEASPGIGFDDMVYVYGEMKLILPSYSDAPLEATFEFNHIKGRTEVVIPKFSNDILNYLIDKIEMVYMNNGVNNLSDKMYMRLVFADDTISLSRDPNQYFKYKVKTVENVLTVGDTSSFTEHVDSCIIETVTPVSRADVLSTLKEYLISSENSEYFFDSIPVPFIEYIPGSTLKIKGTTPSGVIPAELVISISTSTYTFKVATTDVKDANRLDFIRLWSPTGTGGLNLNVMTRTKTIQPITNGVLISGSFRIDTTEKKTSLNRFINKVVLLSGLTNDPPVLNPEIKMLFSLSKE